MSKGRPWPLGSSHDGAGVNFALFSANATRVELCTFESGTMRVMPLPDCTDQVWHGYLPGATPGLQYAFRVHGPEGSGHRFDPQRLLLDPYARELTGVFSYGARTDWADHLKARVADDTFDWGSDSPPEVPWENSVLYEIHVKGASQRHPDVPEALRGTYAGLASPAMIDHYRRLGVTAVNLLPVHCFLDEERLIRSGRTNYWGYNTLAFFAPEPRYAARINGQSAVAEFKSMVRTLHDAGIEVILDVVYNHTAETDEFGPTLSFRGIDNSSYYRLKPDDPKRYENYSGCGNTFNLAHPRVLQLVMDSLRYWVGEMHVDGFRFDLAATLTRDSGFLTAVRQDPLLARVKMIAEPWDLGPHGYHLGRFPSGWGEWNDRFRDDIRAFWLTGQSGSSALARRFSGSSEVFQNEGRSPLAGVNFITAHDGFTLRDLVSYQHKHNELNGENNHDGHNHNHSWNCGVEGESHDPTVKHLRRNLQRSLLATLFLSQGVPMLQGGDELGRTQSGNNNAYCQDNMLTWLDWPQADKDLIDYTAGLIALRNRFPQLRRKRWLTGHVGEDGLRDIVWWHPEGREMATDDWHSPHQGALGLILAPVTNSTEQHIVERSTTSLLILINRDPTMLTFRLPAGGWTRLCDSSAAEPFAPTSIDTDCVLAAHSLQIFSQDLSHALPSS
ncbi:MAG: glycogen debranching protein GlgX [Propionivibrio sp.]|nr:glycogen debranching protein GlgX [Propionivibrio sp.]